MMYYRIDNSGKFTDSAGRIWTRTSVFSASKIEGLQLKTNLRTSATNKKACTVKQ